MPPAEAEAPTITPQAAHLTRRRWATGALTVLLYIGAYAILDLVTQLHAVQSTTITAWSPNIAMMVAVVMHFGLRIAPVTILTPWLSDILTRHDDPLGLPALAEILSVGITFTAAGLLLRRLVPGDRVRTVPGFALLLTVMAISALADAASYSAALTTSGHLRAGTFVVAVTTDWIGDINGIVTLLPCLLLVRTTGGLQLWQLRGHTGELTLQVLALVASFLIVFYWIGNVQLELFYLLFLPINWIALRWGAGVTALALVVLQAAIVVMLTAQPMPQSVLAIQLLMVVLAATGLFMGITVSENARFSRLTQAKDQQLAKLERLAAIAEFNAAVAHELNNPLSALLNYLRAARLQIDQHTESANVEATLDKALVEAGRASSVLTRLRAFFRSGTVQKELTDPRAAATEAMATLHARLLQEKIHCTIDAPPHLPRIEVDKLQLSVVLHNVLSNACDAIRDADAGHGRIAIVIRAVDDYAEFEVSDTGRGMPPSEVPRLFQPLHTNKPLGMGFGLAISRSLLEANGGRIWLVSSGDSGTRIAFRVPQAGESHAS